jgi:apolipoprotein N-acyltransferase
MQFLLSHLVGLSYFLSFAPFDLSFLIFFSIAGFFFFLQQAKTKKQIFFIGWAYGIGLYAGGVHWVYFSISTFGAQIAPIAGLLTIIFIIALGLVYAFFAICYFYISKKIGDRFDFLLLPILWFYFELLRSWVFTGFPWVLAGTSQIDTILGVYLPVFGTYGTGFIVAFMSYAILFFIKKIRTKRFKQFLVFSYIGVNSLIIIVAFLIKDISWSKKEKETINTSIIQGNIKQELKFNKKGLQKSMKKYKNMSIATSGATELIVWPETAVATFYHKKKRYFNDLRRELKPKIVISGIFSKNYKKQEYYNSAIKIGNNIQIYSKEQLVPFGEYMPMRNFFKFLQKYVDIPMSNLAAYDNKQEIIFVKNIPVDVSICYEITYSMNLYKRVAKTNILINISNDAWFGDSVAPHQHLQIARVRAKEYARQMIRATNTGISGFIDEKGNIIKKTRQFESATIQNKMQTYSGKTPFMHYGNIPIHMVLLLLSIISVRQKYLVS